MFAVASKFPSGRFGQPSLFPECQLPLKTVEGEGQTPIAGFFFISLLIRLEESKAMRMKDLSSRPER